MALIYNKSQMEKYTTDSCNFLTTILNNPKLTSTPSRVACKPIVVTNEKLLSTKQVEAKPVKRKPVVKPKKQTVQTTIKQNAQFKCITTKPTSKILKKVKSSDNLVKLKPIKSNLSNLKSKSAQNICETNLNDANNNKKTSQDALKVLEFLIQKSKQNNNDSSAKNITFESLFNELSQMNINLKNNNNNKANNNLECSLDIKLDQMENEIEVLRMQLKQNQFNKITPKLKTLPQPNINNNKYETIDRLQNELRESNKKCQVLEYLLEQKNKQTEKFNFLFKEISDNLNMLVDDLNDKESNYMFNKEKVFNSNDISSLKENLLKFQSKLKNHLKSEQLIINKEANTNTNTNNKETLNTTSSDTLIDADSSFDLVNQKKIFDENKKLLSNNNNNNNNYNTDNNDEFVFNQNTKYYQHKNFIEDDYNDEDDDEDRIFLTMDDLSITTFTLQTSALEETVDGSVDTINLDNYDDEFQNDLQKLDEKIFKVKKLLQSMKKS